MTLSQLKPNMEKHFTKWNRTKKPETYSKAWLLKIQRGKLFYNSRTDLWSTYIDLEVKHSDGNIDKARNLLERALSLDFKKKKVITILKKYHQLESTYGTE